MPTYKIALNFEDGVTRFIDCKDSETVADAAYRQKINVPIDCRDGACGTCKCFAEAGRYDMGDNFIEDALSEDEIAEGYVLTCQMRAESDCVIRIPASSASCKVKAGAMAATMAEVKKLGWNNVRVLTALPGRGGKRALERHVSQLASTPLNHSRPLWQFQLVERYGRGSALIARIHHSYADGMALVQVLLSLTDTERHPQPAQTLPQAWLKADGAAKPVGTMPSTRFWSGSTTVTRPPPGSTASP